MYLGIDTSNYTTSAAAFGGDIALNVSRLLDVEEGQLGLRQSDALFMHVKRLHGIFEQLFTQVPRQEIRAVAASTRPRAVEGSYMPCFLAGESLGRSVAHVLGVPFYAFSHQQGHIAASLWSAKRLDLLEKPHLAWHLSGGTTELLYVSPSDAGICAERIGGTSDIAAGQVVDRAGKLLGLPFPSGKALDALAAESPSKDKFSVKLRDLTFSLSGLENKTAQQLEQGRTREDVAIYALNSLADVIFRTTKAAMELRPNCEVVFSGGVASNCILRRRMEPLCPIFAEPKYSTDNAMGIAVLCSLQEM